MKWWKRKDSAAEAARRKGLTSAVAEARGVVTPDEVRIVGDALLDTPDETAESPSFLDEKEFFKKVRRRSLLRILLVTVLVVLLASGGTIVWQQAHRTAMDNRAIKIDAYYRFLIAMTAPNTELSTAWTGQSEGNHWESRYVLLRHVGDRPVTAGTVTVCYDMKAIWRDQSEDGLWSQDWEGERVYTGRDYSPALCFLAPTGEATGTIAALMMSSGSLPTGAALTRTSLERVAAAPASSTVETALSFKEPMTLEEMEGLLGNQVELVWAPLSTAGWRYDGDPYFWEGSTMGVPFHSFYLGQGDNPSHEQCQEWFVEQLSGMERWAPEYIANGCSLWHDYVTERGFYYTGAVVCGTPEEIEALAASPEVSVVCVGYILAPWE